MREDARKFVSGYTCPACGQESIGIERREPGRRAAAWDFRLEASDDLKITCSSCGNTVPRDHWTLALPR